MSKTHLTKIRKVHMFSLTPGLSVWILTALFWVALTSFVFYMTVYRNMWVPQHVCQATNFTKPTLTAQVENKDEKVLVSKIVNKYNVKPDKAKLIVNMVAANTRQGEFPSKELVLAVISVESGFRHNVISSVGAAGLMQTMRFNSSGHDMFSNIHDGIKVLRDYHKQLKGNTRQTLLAYNSGIGTVLQGKVVNFGYADKVFKELRILKG